MPPPGCACAANSSSTTARPAGPSWPLSQSRPFAFPGSLLKHAPAGVSLKKLPPDYRRSNLSASTHGPPAPKAAHTSALAPAIAPAWPNAWLCSPWPWSLNAGCLLPTGSHHPLSQQNTALSKRSHRRPHTDPGLIHRACLWIPKNLQNTHWRLRRSAAQPRLQVCHSPQQAA